MRALLLALLALIGVGAGIVAQPSDRDTWRAWLFDGTDQLVLVDGNRQVIREYALPLTETHPDILHIIAAPDAETISYVARDGNSPAYQRMVVNTHTGDTRILQERTSTYGISGRAAFDRTGRWLAHADDTWTLYIVDVTTGNIRYALNASVQNLPDALYADILPTVHRFDGQRVWFYATYDPNTVVATGVAGRGFVWDTLTNTVSFSAAYPSNAVKTFPLTGDTLSVNNLTEVHVHDPYYGARWPFYANAIFPPHSDEIAFAQNGSRVLYHGGRWIGDTYQDLWLLLARDGSVVRPLRNIDRHTPHPTADGFIYVLHTADGRSELVHYDTRRALSDRVIWQGEGDWSIIWADTGSRTLPAYEPWAVIGEQIADEPVPVAGESILPTPLPTPAPLFAPGDILRVITNGDVLYLRDSAGTGGDILMYLYDNDRVTLLQGPVNADGYIWWQVEAEDGTVGWAAEASGDVSTLLPLESIVPTLLPTPFPTQTPTP